MKGGINIDKEKKLTNDERRLAARDLTITYINSYYTDWRLAKVLTNEKLLADKYDFYKKIANEIKQYDDEDGEATIAQEIRNGLYFDSIAQCVQYIEDLFAFAKATKQPDFFVRNIISYNAGAVTSYIRNYKCDTPTILEDFHVSCLPSYIDEGIRDRFNTDLAMFIGHINDIVTFYKRYDFFYNQYKHGLAIAMRPFGQKLTPEHIEDEKKGKLEPFLAVYDNMKLLIADSKGRLNVNHGILMPGFTDNVHPFISKLAEENNFLRFVIPPDFPEFKVELLVDIARKIRSTFHVLKANFSYRIAGNPNEFYIHLPNDYLNNSVTTYKYTVNKK
jgi:hypothetical protein